MCSHSTLIDQTDPKHDKHFTPLFCFTITYTQYVYLNCRNCCHNRCTYVRTSLLKLTSLWMINWLYVSGQPVFIHKFTTFSGFPQHLKQTIAFLCLVTTSNVLLPLLSLPSSRSFALLSYKQKYMF